MEKLPFQRHKIEWMVFIKRWCNNHLRMIVTVTKCIWHNVSKVSRSCKLCDSFQWLCTGTQLNLNHKMQCGVLCSFATWRMANERFCSVIKQEQENSFIFCQISIANLKTKKIDLFYRMEKMSSIFQTLLLLCFFL